MFRRNAAAWYPDAKFVEAFNVPYLWPDNEPLPTENYHLMSYNGLLAPVERTVSNVVLNFGPQHPAAHGVLRLVLELDGEVSMQFNCIY